MTPPVFLLVVFFGIGKFSLHAMEMRSNSVLAYSMKSVFLGPLRVVR